MTHLLEAVDLVKVFPGVRAVDGISFSVERGQCFGLLGPNGAGKTTTMEILEGISTPRSGQVLYQGRVFGADHASRRLGSGRDLFQLGDQAGLHDGGP